MVARKGIKYPLARITDACEQPDVGVRNKIWPFGKVKSSLNLLGHLSSLSSHAFCETRFLELQEVLELPV